MKLLELTLNNFGPYKGVQRILFPTDGVRNVMVIYGDNMRGKTSFLNSLRWVLYGRTVDRLSREMDILKLINLESQRDDDYRMSVRLQFEADGRVYDLARSVEPLEYVPTPKSNTHFKQEVLLKRDGSAVRGDEIEQCINSFIPHQVARFYLFDGELLQEYESLLLEESTQGQQIKDAIEQVLGVPALVNGRNEAKELLKKAQALQVKELRHVDALASYTNQSQTLQAQIEAHENDLALEKRSLEGYITRLDTIEKDLSSTSAIQETTQRLSGIKQQLLDIETDCESLRDERNEAIRGAWKDLLQPRIDFRRTELTDRMHALQSSVKKRGAMEDHARRLEQLLASSLCPTCEGVLDESRRLRRGGELGTLRAELLALEVGFQEAVGMGDELTVLNKIRATNAFATLTRVEARLQRQSVAVTRIESVREELEEKLRGHNLERVGQLQKEKDGLLKLRGRVEGNIEAITRDISEKKRLVDHLATLMSRNPEARRLRSSLEVDVYSALVNVFSRGIENLRDRLRERVAEEATRVFRALTTEPSYSSLRINVNYGLSILDTSGRLIPVRSAGAEQVVAMSLLGALNRVVNRPGPLVIDTPFGRLDPRHRSNILKLIPQMAGQVVFLVHEGEINKTSGLEPIATRVAGVYEIQRITETYSTIAKCGALND